MAPDLARGNERGIFPSAKLCPLYSLISHVIDDHWPRPGINQQSPFKEYDFQDSSEQLISMYLETGEEEDNKMVERWQKYAEQILIFVSPVSPFMQIHHVLECNRRVYFLPQLPRCLR